LRSADKGHTWESVPNRVPNYWLTAIYGGSHYLKRPDIGEVGQFAPRVDIQLWEDIRSGRLKEARKAINGVITPYYASVLTMDWVAAYQSLYPLPDICLPERNQRKEGELDGHWPKEANRYPQRFHQFPDQYTWRG